MVHQDRLDHKSDLNYSYSRIHFSRLPQVVTKKMMNNLSQKVCYASKIIYPVIDGFSPNDESSHFHICDHSIVTFEIKKMYRFLKHLPC